MSTTTKKATLMIKTRYPKGDEALDQKSIAVKTYPDAVPLATVSAEASITKNLGNYESLRVQASVTLPCAVAEIENAYLEAWKVVEGELTKKVNQINGASK